jgi:guanylate kinase
MADRHQRGMEAAIDRLEQVSEELACHRDEHKVIVVREIKKVERKKKKIVQQRDGQVAKRLGLKETRT